MRPILAILTLILVGCGSNVAPTPIVIYVTPAPASPAAVASAAAPTEAPTATPTPTPTPAATPAPSFATVALPKLTVKVPGAKSVRYYQVTGSTPDELVISMNERCSAQSWACVETSYTVNWKTSTNLGTGACKVTAASVNLKPIANIPQWSSPAQVYPELLAWWKQVLAHITADQAKYIKIQQAADKKISSLLVGQKCSAANGIILKWKRTTAASVAKFAAQDANWQLPEYTGP
jgi:predicted secreted Zn-dependent protease